MIFTYVQAVANLVAANPDRDIILISSAISRELHGKLSDLISDGKKHDNCIVFLTTNGGDPDGGYRIARCLRHHYTRVRLVIPSLCKSAGTLIAIGADDLAIGDRGELGPLDIQVRKASELEEQSSGLDIIQALEAAQNHAREAFHKTLVEIRRGGRLSTKLAGEFAANVAIGVAEPLYSQIDPNRLGEMQRAMRIAHEYGERLNLMSNALRPGALARLVASYPSHSFVIDRKEAKELFNFVQSASKEEADFCRSIWHVVGVPCDYVPMFIRDEGTPQGENNHGNVKHCGEIAKDAFGDGPTEIGDGTMAGDAGDSGIADEKSK